MTEIQLANALAAILKTQAALVEARRSLEQTAKIFDGRYIQIRKACSSRLADHVRDGAASAAEQVAFTIALLGQIVAFAPDPTEEIDLDDNARAELDLAAAAMRRARNGSQS